MLRPRSRHTYLDALKPPAGFALDSAVGTTFSLDLETLLLVPLGFAMLDWETGKGELTQDPVALLHALRRNAGAITLFCQGGRIAAPTRHHPLFAHLEGMVVEARAPNENAAFHPKVWLLRFSDDERVLYRFICLSRNLTTDRSWDTMLVLEGELTDRENAYAANHPLGQFIEALPNMALSRLTETKRRDIKRLANEVRRVQFQPAEPFETVGFCPLGLEPAAKARLRFPFDRVDRMLVVSPFLSEAALEELQEIGANALISRPESLHEIEPEVLKKFESIQVLEEMALDEDEDEGEAASYVGDQVPATDVVDLRGLHAKIYVADHGWHSSTWVGSANATAAGFGRNVEFLVQLTGRKSKVGIDAFLGADDQGIAAMLAPFDIGPEVIVDKARKANEKLVDTARMALAGAQLRLTLEPAPNGMYNLTARAGTKVALEGVRGTVRPQALKDVRAQDIRALGEKGEISFGDVTPQAISSFLAFDLTAGSGKDAVSVKFCLNLPLEGAPSDRLDLILNEILGDREQLLRYLLFLLARDDDPSAMADLLFREGKTSRGGEASDGQISMPLFEEMVRALARTPEKLDTVDRLVRDLGRTPDGAALLPEGFEQIWQPIWAARVAQQEEAT